MKNFSNGVLESKAGFTLLEILVVIIIVGVLASVAMPNLFRNVERSRAIEALFTLGIMKRQIEGCAAQFGGSDYTKCDTFDHIGMTDPSVSIGAHFAYSIAGVGPGTFTVQATRNALDNGNSGDQVSLSLAGGVVTRSGTGAFSGIQ